MPSGRLRVDSSFVVSLCSFTSAEPAPCGRARDFGFRKELWIAIRDDLGSPSVILRAGMSSTSSVETHDWRRLAAFDVRFQSDEQPKAVALRE